MDPHPFMLDSKAPRRAPALSSDAVHDYLTSIRSYEVLDRSEVETLSMAIEAGVLAGERAAAPESPPEDRLDLVELQRLGRAAEQRLVAHNLKLVVSVARRLVPRSVRLEDAIQAGNAGLITAMQRFDWKLGFTFSTYATWWIRKHVSQEVANSRTIRLPPRPLRQLMDIARAENQIFDQDARTASDSDLAVITGIPHEQVGDLRRVGAIVMSLDQPQAGTDAALVDLLRSEEEELADALHEQTLLRELRAGIDALDPIAAEIITLRYGFDGAPAKTPHRVAQLLHIPALRVIELEKEAIDRMSERLVHLR